MRQPLYLLDVRRNGVGGQGSWAPKEFATIFADARSPEIPYAYLHLPVLCPSIALLVEWRSDRSIPWRVFRDRYAAELSRAALDVAQAFVEAAAVESGIPVFLCAEADEPDFGKLDPLQQDRNYCHRFTLASLLAARLKDTYGTTVQLAHLDMGDFLAQRGAGQEYCRRLTPL